MIRYGGGFHTGFLTLKIDTRVKGYVNPLEN